MESTDNVCEEVEKNVQGRSKPRQPVVRHARSSTKILKEWYTSHHSWPYPTDHEKEILVERTGLTVRQISYWFVNARRRNGNKLSQSAPSTTSLPLSEHFSAQNYEWSDLNPLDRWRHSPPEQEPAPLHAISQAIQKSTVDPGTFLHDVKGPGLQHISNSRPGSASSLDFSASGGSSDSSAYSFRSDPILNFPGQSKLRSRRKRWQKTASRVAKKTRPGKQIKDDDKRIYQCTFCTDTFKSRYDWTRHEESLHLALERWTCLPFGPRHVDAQENPKCALCDIDNPSDAHMQSHHVSKCTGKPLDARIFRRKDHLRQHLRLVHGVDKMTPSMNSWKSKVSRIKSRCGFCEETFLLWSDRNDHLTDHFRAGTLMKDWKGCRGLEPAIPLLVENAIPPYLIGTEANDPEPFSASKGITKSVYATVGSSPAPTAYSALTAGLSEYVHAAKVASSHVTDEALRQQARLILYGDDDP
ncbi:homeobox and c2h2 transcription [Fusarium albosuccineum]|uniref:Homeobox and c2h2 transcription n=1 Tax=Fusarium albosuccineum TaxID=1237068 RepID=A0A8H4P9U1_9HYPO|nr:homeobox and c2h2 transcription [Fusarium albosuccineum]